MEASVGCSICSIQGVACFVCKKVIKCVIPKCTSCIACDCVECSCIKCSCSNCIKKRYFLRGVKMSNACFRLKSKNYQGPLFINGSLDPPKDNDLPTRYVFDATKNIPILKYNTSCPEYEYFKEIPEIYKRSYVDGLFNGWCDI